MGRANRSKEMLSFHLPDAKGAFIVSWPKWLVSCHSLQRAGFNPIPAHVENVVEREREALGKVFLKIRGLLEKYPTFGREKETGLLGALDT